MANPTSTFDDINNPFEEPKWHYEISPEGTQKKEYTRRPPSIVVFTKNAKKEYQKFGFASEHLAIQTYEVLYRIEQLRNIIKEWKADGYPGTTNITKHLLKYWFDRRSKYKRNETAIHFYFAQEEAITTLIAIKELKDKDNVFAQEIKRILSQPITISELEKKQNKSKIAEELFNFISQSRSKISKVYNYLYNIMLRNQLRTMNQYVTFTDKEIPWYIDYKPDMTNLYNYIIKHGNRLYSPTKDIFKESWVERYALSMATGVGKTAVMGAIIVWYVYNNYENCKSRIPVLVMSWNNTITEQLYNALNPYSPRNVYNQFDMVPGFLPPIREILALKVSTWQALQRSIIFNGERVFKVDTEEYKKVLREISYLRNPQQHVHEESDRELLRFLASNFKSISSHPYKAFDILKKCKLLVINDEAHHAYRNLYLTQGKIALVKAIDNVKKNPSKPPEFELKWMDFISALSNVNVLNFVVDMTATPFYAGYPPTEAEEKSSKYGPIFPWTISIFNISDAIESGLVKVPIDLATYIQTVENKTIPSTSSRLKRNILQKILNQFEKVKDLEKAKQALREKSLLILKQVIKDYADDEHDWEAYLISLTRRYSLLELNKELGLNPENILPKILASKTTKKSEKLPLIFSPLIQYFTSKAIEINEKFSFTNDSSKYAISVLLVVSKDKDNNNAIYSWIADVIKLKSGKKLKQNDELIRVDTDSITKELERKGDYTQLSAKVRQQLELWRKFMTVGRISEAGANVKVVTAVMMANEGWDASNVRVLLALRPFTSPLLVEQVVGRTLRKINKPVYNPNPTSPKDLNIEDEFSVIVGLPINMLLPNVIIGRNEVLREVKYLYRGLKNTNNIDTAIYHVSLLKTLNTELVDYNKIIANLEELVKGREGTLSYYEAYAKNAAEIIRTLRTIMLGRSAPTINNIKAGLPILPGFIKNKPKNWENLVNETKLIALRHKDARDIHEVNFRLEEILKYSEYLRINMTKYEISLISDHLVEVKKNTYTPDKGIFNIEICEDEEDCVIMQALDKKPNLKWWYKNDIPKMYGIKYPSHIAYMGIRYYPEYVAKIDYSVVFLFYKLPKALSNERILEILSSRNITLKSIDLVLNDIKS